MKLTILIALGTTLVTLAQKPTLEPQKDWSKERTQLWLDSLVKSLTQETKPAQNVNSGGYYNQNPTLTDEQIRINKYEDEVNTKYRTEKKTKAIAEFSKNIEGADFIFQGVLHDYDLILNTLTGIPEAINGFQCNKASVKIFAILRENQNYKIGSFEFIFKRNKKYMGNSQIMTYIIKGNEITDAYTSNNGRYGRYDGSIDFGSLDSLKLFMMKFKNIDLTEELNVNYEGGDWNLIKKQYESKGLDYNGFVKELKDKYGFKKKLQKELVNAITESVQANSPSFTVSDFNPKTIRAGLGERLTISGSGFGNAYNQNLQLRFKNADYGASTVDGLDFLRNLDLVDFDQLAWSDTRIVVTIPSFISTFNGFGSKSSNTPGSGFFKLVSLNGANIVVTSVTSPMPINIEYSISSFPFSTLTGKNRQYLAYNNAPQCSNVVRWFTVDDAIKNNATILGTVEKVLKDWSDYLKIDIRLSKNGNSEVNTATGFTAFNANSMIFLTDLSTTSGNLMETSN